MHSHPCLIDSGFIELALIETGLMVLVADLIVQRGGLEMVSGQWVMVIQHFLVVSQVNLLGHLDGVSELVDLHLEGVQDGTGHFVGDQHALDDVLGAHVEVQSVQVLQVVLHHTLPDAQ